MDNVTHTLIGIATAEGIATREKFRKHRVSLWIASGIANNLPDADVLFTIGHRDDKLRYLLHHRGYTHTVLLAPLQSLLLLGILGLIWRKRTGIPWRAVALLTFLGPLLHLFADSWNSYGVHPFWPFYNQWLYGDLVFIIEPWLWALLLPLIFHRCETRLGKAIALLLLGGLLVTCWSTPFVTTVAAAMVTLGSIGWILAQRKLESPAHRVAVAAVFLSAVFSLFALSEFKLRRHFSPRLTELALLTHPANPFCYTVLTAGFSGSTYHAAAFTAAPWPNFVPATSCPQLISREGTAGLQSIPELAPNPERVPIGQFVSSMESLSELKKSCRARAYFRFARIPFWRIAPDGSRSVGDLRFDRGKAGSFAELRVGGADDLCPALEPPWEGRFFIPEG